MGTAASVRPVEYEAHSELPAQRRIAAIRTTAPQSQIGAGIIGSLDLIWPVLRQQGVETGHNVVIYYSEAEGIVTMDVGVEVLSDLIPSDQIRLVMTPPGEVATSAHFGEYSDLGGAYNAVTHWCTANGRRSAGTSWEVYGDWEDDPAKRRTDVFILLEPTAS